MTLPNEVEELLDVLRREKLGEAMAQIARLIELGISGEDLEWMLILERIILKVFHMEGVEGYRQRQMVCEEIARSKSVEPQRKAS